MVMVTRLGTKRKRDLAAKALTTWWKRRRAVLGVQRRRGDTGMALGSQAPGLQALGSQAPGLQASPPEPVYAPPAFAPVHLVAVADASQRLGSWEQAPHGVHDFLTEQPIIPGAWAFKYMEELHPDTWITASSLEAYLECAGELKFKSHVFTELELTASMGEPAYARIQASHQLPTFNAEDPFTLEPPVPPVCRLRPSPAAAGVQVAGMYTFSAQELARYLRATGCFKNPLDNAQLSREHVRLVGAISGDHALAADMESLQVQRESAAAEERLLEFLGAEVTLKFNDMMALANDDDTGMVEDDESEAVRIGFLLPEMHVSFIVALADLDAASRPQCTQAIADAREKWAAHKAESERIHGMHVSKNYAVYKFAEISLDSWVYASDMFRPEESRIIKMTEVMRVHQALLESA
jgi:hypothetical protein